MTSDNRKNNNDEEINLDQIDKKPIKSNNKLAKLSSALKKNLQRRKSSSNPKKDESKN